MSVMLRELRRADFPLVYGVAPALEQRLFLATPDIAAFLASSHLHPTFRPHAIESDGSIAGVVSFGTTENTGIWWVSLLVIDAAFQGRGIGRKAMTLVIESIARSAAGKAWEVGLAFHPENERARSLYRSLGFIEEPNLTLDGEQAAWLRRAAHQASQT